MTAPERKKLRVLALVHPDLIPPEDAKRDDASPWKMEYDVVHALRELEHEVMVVGVGDELGTIRNAVYDFKPHIDGAWYRCCGGQVRKLVDCCSYSRKRINGDASLTGYCYKGRRVFCVMYFQTKVKC